MVSVDQEVIDTFDQMIEVFGTNPLDQVRSLSSAEVDLLADELLAVRAVKDIVEGRENALKAYSTSVINYDLDRYGQDSSTTSGFLLSEENGIKLSKEVSGGKLSVDVDKLEQILEEDQFNSVTNLIHEYRTVTYPGGKTVEETKVYRELNEESLEKELKLGNIGMEQIVRATTPGKVRTSFYVRAV